MEVETTITVALYSLLSATLAAFITAKLNSIYNNQLKQIEYRNAYYQKLIDKRLAGLDELLDMLKYFRETMIIAPRNELIKTIYYHTPSIYKDVFPEIQKAFNNTIWLGPDAYQSGLKLRNTFFDIHEEIVKSNFDVDKIFELGIKNESRLREAAKEFHFYLTGEYFNVHDFEPIKKMYLPNDGWQYKIKRLFHKQSKELPPSE